MNRFLAGTALAGAVFVHSPAMADTLGEDAAAFGARRTISDIALSPSGNKIMYVEPGTGSDETVYVVDLAAGTDPRGLVTTNEAKARLNGCNWGSERYILCQVYGYNEISGAKLGFTRMLSIDAETGKTIDVSAPFSNRAQATVQNGGTLVALEVDGEDDKVLMTRQFVKENSAGTNLYSDEEGLGVELVDLGNARRTRRERPNDRAIRYIADENGDVRIMGARNLDGYYAGDQLSYSYRPLGSKGWETLTQATDTGGILRGFLPVAVDSGKNVAYGFESLDGFTVLSTLSLDGNNTRQIVLKHPDVDVDELVRVGRNRRVVGVSYATERRMVDYFDPELSALASAMGKALPGKPLVSIVDASEGEDKILMIASSDTDPGMAYLYDKSTKQLAELLPVRQQLEGREMGEMRPITYPAADGTMIPGYLTLPPGSDGKNLPAIVMPHGGPQARDEWGFDWLTQFFAAQGYAVLRPNFRGSAGYGEAWFGRNGFQAWETAVGDVNSAGRWLVSQGIADPAKLATVGWSYGGYAALQSQVLDPDLFKAVVGIAPVTDLAATKEEKRRYSSFARINEYIGSGPHIEAGSPAQHADRFKAPVLLVHGTMDMNVSSNQSQLMESRLKSAGKQVEYLEFDGLDHGLVHAQARGIMLRRIGEFLAKSLGG